jgi:glycerol kinase
MPALLAIDAGTTGITTLVVSDGAQVVARGYAEFDQHFPADGLIEHDLGQMWAATLAATRNALDAYASAGSPAGELVAVGVTNQRETACLWDRETLGSPRRAIVWQDRRTAALCESMREDGHELLVVERTGLRLDPYFTATKLSWIRANDPHAWAGVESGRTAIGTVDAYLVARMSRGLFHITDATNASRTLLYDIVDGAWSPRLCALFGVPMSALPEVTASYGRLARTDPTVFCGLDLPITGIAGDQQAALVGQAGFRAGDAKCTYGTGSFLLVHTGDRLQRSAHGLLTTVALAHPDGRRDFALEGAVFVTGAAVQWLRDGLGIIGSAAEVEELAASVPDSGGVVFVPALTGLGAPDWDPTARGLVIGITRGTTSAHLARATLEAIALQVKDVVDLMAREGDVRLDRLRVDGGAAANSLLCQLQANTSRLLVDRSAELETTGLGAAFLAGLGAGVWASPDELVSTRRSSATFAPGALDPALHERWREAVARSKHWSA